MKIGFDLRKHMSLIARVAKRAMHLRGEEGSAELVEFAFVLPGLMIVLTGTVSFALALYNLQQLGNATANAVQTIVDGAGITADPCAQAVTTVSAALPGWNAANFTYTLAITYTPSGSGTTALAKYSATGSGFTCAAGAANLKAATNYPVVLTVKSAYAWFPILSFSPSSPLVSTQGAVGN